MVCGVCCCTDLANALRLGFALQRAFVVVLPLDALSLVAGNYSVLGGQHVSYALVDMWKDAMKCGKGVPAWLGHVMVEVIVTKCPLQSRQMIFGDHNAIQLATTSLTMGQIWRCLGSEMQTSNDPKSTLITALHKCGKLGFSTGPCIFVNVVHHDLR